MKLSNLFNDCVRVAQGLRKGSARPAREWLKSMTVLALLLIIGVDSAWGDTSATYTVSSTTSVSSSGTAPTGSSASYSQDYSTAGQMTNASKNSHLTLSGYDGKRIKGVSLSMRATNSKKGSITIKVGSTTICSSSGSVPTSNSFYSYVMTLSSNPTVGTNEKITIDISASGSSVFIQSYTITYDSPTMRTVTWYVNGEEYTTGSPSTSVADGGKVSTLPTTPSISCGGKSFVGWTTSSSYSNASIPPTVLFADAADSPIISGNTNFYAIFANTVDNGSETSITGGNMANSLPSSWSGTNDGFYSGNGAKFTAVNQYVQSANISSNAYTSVTVKFKAGKNGSTGSVLTIATLDANSNVITSKTFSPSEEYNSQSTINALTLTAGTTIKYVRITMTTRVANVGMKYCEVFHPRYTYSNYATSCCTELASINGSVSWSNPTTAVLTWNKLADQVDSWALNWSPKPGGSSASAITDTGGGTQKTATVSGLACGTEYTFTLTPTTKSGVCTVTTDPTIVSTSTKYAIAKSATNGSFTTKVSSTAVTSTCDGSTVAIDATANNGYSFTSWTITNTSTSADVTSSVSLNSSTNKNATFTMPAYNVTVTAAFSCLAPTFGTDLSTATVEYTQGDVSTALTVVATANNATINYQWQTKVGSGEWTNTGTNAPGNTSITPSTSSAVTTQYRCIATNTACGSIATSNVATIQVNEPSCTAPTAVASSSPTSTGATLTVTDANNVNKYDFYCSTSNDAPNNLTTPTASVSGSKEKAITGLDYAKTYYYWARTDCSGSTSGWFPESDPSTFTTTCPAPTSISAGSITRSGATFTITDNNSPTIVSFGSGYGYEIYYSTTNSEPGASPSGTVTTTTTSKAVTGLTTGTTYYVWVRGYGPAAKSSWVSGGSFTVDILDHITITAPTKTTYFAGETFVSTGATVTAHYSPSETTATVTGSATWTPTAALTTGNTTATASYTEQGVTKTEDQTINVYSVTVNKVDEDGAAIDNANVTATWTVGTKTLSASVGATNYVFKNWEFANNENKGLTINNTGNTSTTVSGTPTGNVIIKAVFYKPVTVTWKVGSGNASGGTSTVRRGTQWQALTLPTTPNDNALEVAQGGCIENGKGKFMGWTNASDLIGEGNSVPDPCLTSFSGVTSVINSPIVFKAVYAKETASTTVFKRVTNISDLSAASKIVIVSNASSKVINTDCSAADAPTESSSEITASSTYIWTLSGNSTDGWKFKDGSGNTLGAATVAASGNGNNNKPVSITSNNSTWTIGEHNTSNYFYICSGANTSSKACLDYYSNWQLYYVTSFSSNSYTAMKLYIPKVTYSDYITKCCTHLEAFPGSLTLSSVSESARSFSWTKESTVGDVAHYELSYKVKNAVGDPTSIANNIANNTNSYTHTADLTAGTTYTYYLTAIGANGHCDEVETKDVTIPKITTSGTPAAMTYIEGQGPSTTDCHFTVSGVGLTGNLTVTAPENFQVSKTSSSSGFGSSVTLTPSSGSISSQAIWVQLVSGLSANTYGPSNVTISGGSAADVTVAVNGTVSPACDNPTITAQPAASASYNLNVTATALSVTATKNGTGPDLTYQWYSNTANSKTTPAPSPIEGATNRTYTPLTTAIGTKYYFCEISSGACSITADIAAVTVNTPSLTVSETARAFGDREVNAGPYTMTFTVSGSNLAKDAPITISGASGMFSVDKTSISQTSAGAVSTTTITVTYNPTTAGSHNATLTIASTGATSKTVTLSGTGKAVASVILHVQGTPTTITPEAPKTKWLEGDSYTLPSTATACTEMTFYGWYTEAYSHATEAPSGAKFVAKGGSKTLAAGENHFYAVYAEADETATTYTKITSTSDLTTGDYLIAGLNYYCMSNTVNASNYMNEVNMSSNYDSETGVITNASNSDIVWTITKNGSNYTLYNAAASKYLALTTTSPAVQTSAHNFTVSYAGTCWTFTSTSVTNYRLVYNYQFYSQNSAGSNSIFLYKYDGNPKEFTTSPSCSAHDLTVETDPAADAGGTAEAVKTTLREGKTTTATATPDEHYTFSHWTISGDGSAMSNTVSGKSTDNPVTVTMGTEDATLTAHFTEKPKCTVEFYNNGGSAISSTTYWLGETPVAPTLTDGTSHDACDATSDTHYGWTKTKITTTIETQAEVDALTGDAVIYTKGITLPAVATGDDGTTIKYHAVWAKATGSSSYELITSLDDLKAGDAYLGSYINYSGWRYYGATSNSAMANVTVSGDPLALSSTTGLVRVTLVATANANEYQIKNSSNQYLYANSTGSAPSWSATACAWTFSNKDANNLFKVKSSLGTYYLRSYASSTTAGALKMYGTETNSGICVFQQGIVYSKFLTTCCDDFVTIGTPTVTGSGAVTFSIGGEAVAAGTDVETCTAGKTIVATVTPATGYSCTTLSFSRDDAVTLDIDVDPSSTKPSAPSYQDYTMTFEKGADITLSTSATFSPIPVSSLSLRVQQTGQSDKVGNDLTMSCYPKEGQSGGNDPLNHTLKVLFEEVLPANALDKAYDWSVRVKATGDAVWTAVGFTGNALNTNTIINSYNKSTGNLQIKATEGTAEIKITAHDGSGVNAKVTITVANVAMSSVSVSPTEMEVYAGQKKPVTVTFTPANATDRSYSAGSSYTYVNIQNKGASSFNIEGKTSVTDANHDETVTVTTTDGSKTATIDVTVKPLPKVMFVDNVHNESFANVIATVDDGGLTVTTTKSTPTHSDVSDPGASYNTCERQHLHLIGWILSTWADANPSAGNDAIKSAGAGKYYSAGADIDLEAQNGKTYYAVWTKIE